MESKRSRKARQTVEIKKDTKGPSGVHTVLVYDLLGNPLSFIYQAGGSNYIKPPMPPDCMWACCTPSSWDSAWRQVLPPIYDAGVANPIINLL